MRILLFKLPFEGCPAWKVVNCLSSLSSSICDQYAQYLALLKDLVAIPSVFTDRKGIERAIQYCREGLEASVPGWDVSFDAKHNLIACPPAIQKQEPIVYLSAHVDTVDADAAEWAPPHRPFEPIEDEREIRGRGVSDCKAGVAYELFLAWLHAQQFITLQNIVLTVTFNEEGSGDKTATEIARCLGTSLPVSDAATYLIALENNVRAQAQPILSIYDRERGNFVIKTRGPLSRLQTWLQRHDHWNPVCITPDGNMLPQETLHQESRHVCSVPRQENLLYRMILEATPNTTLRAGEERSFGVLPPSIALATAPGPVEHTVILSNRSFDTLEQVRGQLKGMSYEEMKPFSFSQGLDVREKLSRSPLNDMLNLCRTEDLDIELTHNIGCSDASIMYNSMDPAVRDRLIPIVMGPGTRSQPNARPPRFTHGRNETLDKESARRAMVYIASVLAELQVLKPL